MNHNLVRAFFALALGSGVVATVTSSAHADRVATTAQDARLVPLMEAGRLVGFKVYAIREGSRYARARLASGDTITAIDGVAIKSESDAAKITAARRDLPVTVVRKGQVVKLTIPAR